MIEAVRVIEFPRNCEHIKDGAHLTHGFIVLPGEVTVKDPNFKPSVTRLEVQPQFILDNQPEAKRLLAAQQHVGDVVESSAAASAAAEFPSVVKPSRTFWDWFFPSPDQSYLEWIWSFFAPGGGGSGN
jgi:hypothetical protein